MLLAIGGFAWAVFDERGYMILTDLVVLTTVLYLLLEPYEGHQAEGLEPRTLCGTEAVDAALHNRISDAHLVPLTIWFWAHDDELSALDESERALSLAFVRSVMAQETRPDLTDLEGVKSLPDSQVYISFHQEGVLLAQYRAVGIRSPKPFALPLRPYQVTLVFSVIA